MVCRPPSPDTMNRSGEAAGTDRSVHCESCVFSSRARPVVMRPCGSAGTMPLSRVRQPHLPGVPNLAPLLRDVPDGIDHGWWLNWHRPGRIYRRGLPGRPAPVRLRAGERVETYRDWEIEIGQTMTALVAVLDQCQETCDTEHAPALLADSDQLLAVARTWRNGPRRGPARFRTWTCSSLGWPVPTICTVRRWSCWHGGARGSTGQPSRISSTFCINCWPRP